MALSMNHEERVAALERCGYRPRQAAFLALVMVSGGYFLRRHYAAFLHQRDGAVGTVFLGKALARGHVERAPFVRRAQVYHVTCPALYAAIGEPHSRSQRTAPITNVVERLMLLDVLVAHPAWRVLATERDRLAWLSARGVPVNAAGGLVLVSRSGPDAARRARWIGRAPVCLDGSEPLPTFIYVRSPTRPPSDFDTFLARHRTLFARLGSVRVVFCCDWAGAVPDAEGRAHRVAHGLSPDYRALDDVSPRQALLTYFEARQRFIRRQFRTFDEASREQLRLDLARFDGPDYEVLYARWEDGGDAVIGSDDIPRRPSSDTDDAFDLVFVPHVVLFSYPMYGDDRGKTRHGRTTLEKQVA